MGACAGYIHYCVYRVFSKKKNSKQDQLLREAFNKVDKDKSGFIEKNELVQMLNDIAKDMNAPLPQQNEIDEAMKVIDQNKDGKINFAEYKKFVESALKEQNVA